MWVAVFFTVLASAGNSIGKIMQKQGTKGLPQLALNITVMRAYLTTPTWTLGFGLDVFGALAMLKAVSEAPEWLKHKKDCAHLSLSVLMLSSIACSFILETLSMRSSDEDHTGFMQVSVVQPVSGCGLAILAIFSHFYLHETMNSLDWLGVALAGVGTIGVGMAGEEQATSDLHIFRLMWFILWAVLLFGALDWWTQVQKAHHRRSHEHAGQVMSPPGRGSVLEEVVAGMEAGTCFGMAAVVARLGFMLADKLHSSMYVPVGIVVGVCCSAGGFFCQTKGLKEGRAVVVSTCAAVASIITGVLVGMLTLGETLPVSTIRRSFLLIGWLFIILGVVLLMGSSRIGPMLPRSLRPILRPRTQSHKSNPRLVQFSRREPSASTVVQLFTPPKSSPAKVSP